MCEYLLAPLVWVLFFVEYGENVLETACIHATPFATYSTSRTSFPYFTLYTMLSL